VSTEIAISSALRPLSSPVVLVMFLLMLCLDRNSHEHARCYRAQARHELACTSPISASGLNQKVANIAEQHVPIRVTILYKFASYSSNKADDDSHHCFMTLRVGCGPFISSDGGIKLDRGAVLKKFYYPTEGGSPQHRRERDDANVIF
jgi:hypothetical protein